MATSRISPDADALVSEIEVAAPPQRVFEALIDQKQVMQWWAADGAMTQRKGRLT